MCFNLFLSKVVTSVRSGLSDISRERLRGHVHLQKQRGERKEREERRAGEKKSLWYLVLHKMKLEVTDNTEIAQEQNKLTQGEHHEIRDRNATNQQNNKTLQQYNSPQRQKGAKTAEAEKVLVWSLYTEKGSDFRNHEVRRGPAYCACVIPPVLQTCCVYQWLHLWRQSLSSEFENVGPAGPEAGRYHGSDCPGESCIFETVSGTD